MFVVRLKKFSLKKSSLSQLCPARYTLTYSDTNKQKQIKPTMINPYFGVTCIFVEC
jgi:hypothetical protein